MNETIERLAMVIYKEIEYPRYGEPSMYDCRRAAAAAIKALRWLTDDPGPNYAKGEYSRRNIEAMIYDALARPEAPPGTLVQQSGIVVSEGDRTDALRWQPRVIVAYNSLGQEETQVTHVLQQCWRVLEYQDGDPFKQHFEWRDVPTSTD
jgi:hypothetical protein